MSLKNILKVPDQLVKHLNILRYCLVAVAGFMLIIGVVLVLKGYMKCVSCGGCCGKCGAKAGWTVTVVQKVRMSVEKEPEQVRAPIEFKGVPMVPPSYAPMMPTAPTVLTSDAVVRYYPRQSALEFTTAPRVLTSDAVVRYYPRQLPLEFTTASQVL